MPNSWEYVRMLERLAVNGLPFGDGTRLGGCAEKGSALPG